MEKDFSRRLSRRELTSGSPWLSMALHGERLFVGAED
jgi:hypothetical protein